MATVRSPFIYAVSSTSSSSSTDSGVSSKELGLHAAAMKGQYDKFDTNKRPLKRSLSQGLQAEPENLQAQSIRKKPKKANLKATTPYSMFNRKDQHGDHATKKGKLKARGDNLFAMGESSAPSRSIGGQLPVTEKGKLVKTGKQGHSSSTFAPTPAATLAAPAPKSSKAESLQQQEQIKQASTLKTKDEMEGEQGSGHDGKAKKSKQSKKNELARQIREAAMKVVLYGGMLEGATHGKLGMAMEELKKALNGDNGDNGEVAG